MRSLSRCAVAALSLCLTACTSVKRPAPETVLVSQPSAVDSARVGLGCFSSSQSRPTRNYKRGDDCVIKTAATLTGVRWWGLSEGRVFDDLRNFDAYTLEVFEGAPAKGGPLPGTRVWQGTFPASTLDIAPTGRIATQSGAAEYRYAVRLPEGVELKRGGVYVIAISAHCVDPQGDAWQWQDAEDFGGHGASYSYAANTWSVFQDTDSAFELIGVSRGE